MKKKSRIEMAREIVMCVRREMQRPRLAESVRETLALEAEAASAALVKRPATRAARA